MIRQRSQNKLSWSKINTLRSRSKSLFFPVGEIEYVRLSRRMRMQSLLFHVGVTGARECSGGSMFYVLTGGTDKSHKLITLHIWYILVPRKSDVTRRNYVIIDEARPGKGSLPKKLIMRKWADNSYFRLTSTTKSGKWQKDEINGGVHGAYSSCFLGRGAKPQYPLSRIKYPMAWQVLVLKWFTLCPFVSGLLTTSV